MPSLARKGFNPNSADIQVFKAGEISGDVKIEAFRGIGSLTNIKGKKINFRGRRLDSKEMTIVPGEIDGKPWVITVKAEDGSSTHTYKIKIER